MKIIEIFLKNLLKSNIFKAKSKSKSKSYQSNSNSYSIWNSTSKFIYRKRFWLQIQLIDFQTSKSNWNSTTNHWSASFNSNQRISRSTTTQFCLRKNTPYIRIKYGKNPVIWMTLFTELWLKTINKEVTSLNWIIPRLLLNYPQIERL